MKPQDILFFIIVMFLIFKRKPLWLVVAGLLCLFLSIPLFAKQVFFTAEHLVWYAAGFMVLGIILLIIRLRERS